MYEPVRYLPILADALQVLFGWWVVTLALVMALSRTMDVKRRQRWLRFGVLVGLLGGILGLVASGACLLGMANTPDAAVRASLTERLSGPYAWGLRLSLVTQLLWVATLVVARSRASWWLAWAVALVMSLPFERSVILITSLHRDYVPSGWTVPLQTWRLLLLPLMLLVSAPAMWFAQQRARHVNSDRSE